MQKKQSKEVYVNPLTDFGFARVFAQEENKDLLIDFLNTIIDKEELITDIEYLPPNQFGFAEKDRKAVFDIFCKTKNDEHFIVEMQRTRQEYFADRSLFYSAFPILNQAPKGEWNFKLKAVYTVAVLDFVLFKEEPDDEKFYLERIHLTRERTKKQYSDKLDLIFIELPKFRKKEIELTTNADYWIYSLKHAKTLTQQPEKIKGVIFDKLFETLDINQLTGREMETYQKSVLEYRDVKSAIRYARQESFEEGLVKGVRKGMKEGMRKGMEKSMEKVAQNLLLLNISVDDISKATGLTPEQINALRLK